MPHQCLNCGKVFPSGSPEILKGCGNCGGRKFFFTQQALSQTEREEMTQIANRDLRDVIKNVLAATHGKSSDLMDLPRRDEWVEVRVPAQQPPVASEPTTTVSEESPPPGRLRDRTKPDWIQTSAIYPSAPVTPASPQKVEEGTGPPLAERLVEEIKTTPPETPPPQPTTPVQQVEPEPVPVPEPEGQTAISPEPVHVAEDEFGFPDQLGVIKVKEHGVYEIDLEGLLNNSPIIVQRNGTYLIHLPSVFQNMTPQDLKKRRRWKRHPKREAPAA